MSDDTMGDFTMRDDVDDGLKTLETLTRRAKESGIGPPSFWSASEISSELETTFGLGDDPITRKRFYAWIGATCEQYGAAAVRIVRAARIQAARSRKPDRYFCNLVRDRFRHELGV